MMNHAGGQKDVRLPLERERVRYPKVTAQPFFAREAFGVTDERRVEVAAEQLDVVTESAVRREPAQHEPHAAADVDDANGPLRELLSQYLEQRPQQLH